MICGKPADKTYNRTTMPASETRQYAALDRIKEDIL